MPPVPTWTGGFRLRAENVHLPGSRHAHEPQHTATLGVSKELAKRCLAYASVLFVSSFQKSSHFLKEIRSPHPPRFRFVRQSKSTSGLPTIRPTS
jgi:hypothetical protein